MSGEGSAERITVYTVGHSNRELGEFLRLLRDYSIKVVVDVRRFPTSRRFPHFNREALAETLAREGISYVWLGDLLGGFRKGGYERYMETADFEKGLARLLEVLRREKGVAIMCRERLWFKCHRRFIADRLVEMGYVVIHIIDPGRTYRHKGRAREHSAERRETEA